MIRSMVAKRQEGGRFKSLEDFLQRMGEGELNKRAVENFIKCGAMDCFGYHRSEMLAAYDQMMDTIASTRKKNLEGQIGMFSMFEETDKAAAIPMSTKRMLQTIGKSSGGGESFGRFIAEYMGILSFVRKAERPPIPSAIETEIR